MRISVLQMIKKERETVRKNVKTGGEKWKDGSIVYIREKNHV